MIYIVCYLVTILALDNLKCYFTYTYFLYIIISNSTNRIRNQLFIIIYFKEIYYFKNGSMDCLKLYYLLIVNVVMFAYLFILFNLNHFVYLVHYFFV